MYKYDGLHINNKRVVHNFWYNHKVLLNVKSRLPITCPTYCVQRMLFCIRWIHPVVIIISFIILLYRLYPSSFRHDVSE